MNNVTTIPPRLGQSPLSAADLCSTADFISSCQLPSGMILWHQGGHADVWNHTEAAMALSVAGSTVVTGNTVAAGSTVAAGNVTSNNGAASDYDGCGNDYLAHARKAFGWLADSQLPDGSWHSYYIADGVEDPKIDTNCCAYPAVGVWHHYLITASRDFLETMWPVIDKALNFVVGLSREDHHIPWAVHPDGTRWSYSLLTGTCSIVMSLEAGLAMAVELGHKRPDWKLALKRLKRLVKCHPESFEPKHRWAMDWYYPVLCGAVSGAAALAHLNEHLDRFVRDNNADGILSGVRCVYDKPWVTAAETCECALAYLRAGEPAIAERLFSATADLRDVDGAYFTGLVLPEEKTFPHAERTSYTAAAVLLAADAIAGLTPAAGFLIAA